MERKLISRDEELSRGYKKIVREQLESIIFEHAPDEPTGNRVFYMPHKTVVRNNVSTTKIRIVFDQVQRPSP